jgi:hypothetical protein
MFTNLEIGDRPAAPTRLAARGRTAGSRVMQAALERAVNDADLRPLLFVLMISGLAALIAAAVRTFYV